MKNELKEIWEERYNEWKESGLSKSKWYEENNFNIHQLYYWFKKFNKQLKEQPNEIKWLPIQVEDNLCEIAEHNTISIRIGKCNVDVKSGFNTDQLSKVIEMLIRLC